MKYSNAYWDARLDCEKPVPEKIKKAIKRVYESYPGSCMPQGLADPMYIINVLAHEIGFGDGQGNFCLPED